MESSTVVIHEIRNTDAKKRGIQARVKTGEPLSPHNTACRVKGGRLRSFRLHLSASRQSDEGISGGEELDRQNNVAGVKLTSGSWTRGRRQLQRGHGRCCHPAERRSLRARRHCFGEQKVSLVKPCSIMIDGSIWGEGSEDMIWNERLASDPPLQPRHFNLVALKKLQYCITICIEV